MMNSSGSEFALRVALCDLVQRLKRSEFMCQYLTECRNQLANEVIKLRSHNNLLLNQLFESPHSSNKTPFNQQLQNPQPNQLELDLDQNEYKKSVKLDSIVDESWEEITNRLISQLKKEILNAETEEQSQLNPNEEIQEKKSTLCSSGSNYFDLKSDQNAENLAANEPNEYETQEQHMAINDLELKAADELNRELNKDLNNLGNGKDGGDKMKFTFKLLEDYSLINQTTNNNLKVIEVHKNKEQQKCNIQELLKDYLKQNKQSSQVDLIEKILHNYNQNLEEVIRQITVQNDRLFKLKGKQIRNYFRRQLDKNTAGSGPNSELKIN